MRMAKASKQTRYWARQVWQLAAIVGAEIFRTKVFDTAASVAFYFLLSLVPLLLTFAALLAFLPVPTLFEQLLYMMAMLVPPDSLNMVAKVVSGILTPHHGVFWFGLLGYLWSSAGGFSSLIGALDVAYDVKVPRPWWRDRLQALLLTLTSCGFVTISLVAMFVGPQFGSFISSLFPIPSQFGHIWPILRIIILIVAFVAGLELVYFLGPNIHQHFLASLPGAIFAICVWFAGSSALSFYLQHMAHYNITYGSLGAVIGLMLWCYVTALAILIGAELNAELAKRRKATARQTSETPAQVRSR